MRTVPRYVVSSYIGLRVWMQEDTHARVIEREKTLIGH